MLGSDLSDRADLKDKLITNQERFEKICEILSKTDVALKERVEGTITLIEAASRYRYVPETGLDLSTRISTMIGAVKLASKTLLECGESINTPFKESIERFLIIKKSQDNFAEMEGIDGVIVSLKKESSIAETACGRMFSSDFRGGSTATFA